MDILAIKVRDDGTTIGGLRTLDEAEMAMVELEFSIVSLKSELDQAWADRAERGITTSADWLSETRAELRETEVALRALTLYAKKMKNDAKQDKARIRQAIMLEAAGEIMTTEQWEAAKTLFHQKLDQFNAGTYSPRGWEIKSTTRTGVAA